MELVIEHSNLAIFKRDKDTLNISLLSDFKLAYIGDLRRHGLDKIDPSLVVERIKILIHSRDYQSLV